jgi:hypothetical protein
VAEMDMAIFAHPTNIWFENNVGLVGGFNPFETYYSMGRIIPYINIYYGKLKNV